MSGATAPVHEVPGGGHAGDWPPITRRRKASNLVFWSLCLLALALVIVPTLWLVVGIIARAAPHFHFSVLWTKTAGLTGGLVQPILGTLTITVGALIIGGIISVLTGLYLSEFAAGWHRGILRGAYEVLSGIPSIVLGLVGYLALCVNLHMGFGLLPAVLVISVLMIPYMTKSTETSLAQVPTGYREGAEALGIPTSWAMRKVVVKAALPGMITGFIVAIAISVGETAPLLYTAGFATANPSLAHPTHQALSYLTGIIWTFSPFTTPTNTANILSYDAALVLMVIVLVLILVGRLVATSARRYAE
jgi:phosphate transport system permease protein